MDAYRAVAPNAPFGCINGGGVYDAERGEYVWLSKLADEAGELVSHIEKKFPNVGIQTCCFDKTYFSKENNVTVRFRAQTDLPNIFCPFHEVKEPVAKVLFCTDIEEEIKAIERELRSHPLAYKFDFIRSEHSLFEILPKGVHKGVSIDKMVEYLGVDRAKTVAVGDYDNDVGMLKSAGLGIAVANASKAALDAADVVTVSNEEHAIAEVIYGIESGKYKL